jgi:hypothetical protein
LLCFNDNLLCVCERPKLAGGIIAFIHEHCHCLASQHEAIAENSVDISQIVATYFSSSGHFQRYRAQFAPRPGLSSTFNQGFQYSQTGATELAYRDSNHFWNSSP